MTVTTKHPASHVKSKAAIPGKKLQTLKKDETQAKSAGPGTDKSELNTSKKKMELMPRVPWSPGF